MARRTRTIAVALVLAIARCERPDPARPLRPPRASGVPPEARCQFLNRFRTLNTPRSAATLADAQPRVGLPTMRSGGLARAVAPRAAAPASAAASSQVSACA